MWSQTRVSPEEIELEALAEGQVESRFDAWDAAAVGFQESWRAGPTASIIRGVQSVFDTSKKLDPIQANKEYGLEGTPYEFGEDEEVTVDRAKAVAKDMNDLALNELITQSAVENSGMARAAQFAGSIAAGLVDPALLAANIGGAQLIGAGMKWATANKMIFGGVNKVSPALGGMLESAYKEGVRKSLSTVIAREGAENFLGGAIEETIGAATDGFGGSDRLARKIELEERLFNVGIGTFLGTGLGVTISKDGRRAFGRLMGKRYGDDAEAYLLNEGFITMQEAAAGVEKSSLTAKIHDRDSFAPREWHNEKYQFTPDATTRPDKVYISVKEDGDVFRYQHRGEGVVYTDNINHAYNKGSKVIEVETKDLNIIDDYHMVHQGKSTAPGGKIADALVQDLVANTDTDKLVKALAILDDPDINLERAPALNAAQVLRDKLEGKTLDEMIDILDEVGVRTLSAYDPHRALEEIVDSLGFHGYQFIGKNAQGQGAYRGLYVTKKTGELHAKGKELETPKPSETHLHKWKREEDLLLKEYADWLHTKAKPLAADGLEASGAPKETPRADLPEPKSEIQAALVGSEEKQSLFEEVKARIRESIDELKQKGTTDSDAEGTLRLADEISSGKSFDEIVGKQMEMNLEYLKCRGFNV